MKKGKERRKYPLEFKKNAISLDEKIGVCKSQGLWMDLSAQDKDGNIKKTLPSKTLKILQNFKGKSNDLKRS